MEGNQIEKSEDGTNSTTIEKPAVDELICSQWELCTVRECDKKFSVFAEGLRFLKGTGSRQGLSLVS